jgi:hypothetical protein
MTRSMLDTPRRYLRAGKPDLSLHIRVSNTLDTRIGHEVAAGLVLGADKMIE